MLPVHKHEYDELRQHQTEYFNLRNALLTSGLDVEALAILCQDGSRDDRKDNGENDRQDDRTDSGYFGAVRNAGWSQGHSNETRPTPAFPPGLPQRLSKHVAPEVLLSEYRGPSPGQQHHRVAHEALTWQQQSDFGPPTSRTNFDEVDDDFTGYGSDTAAQYPHFARHDRRTIVITGLSDHITYKHLTNVIRGGRILYITITPDRRALVFMLEGAAEFIAHVRRHDLYVQSKRVCILSLHLLSYLVADTSKLEVGWNDHQFALAPYVARRIAAGASRNLILRKAAKIPNVAENIREHMEHIHKFDIIDIKFLGHDVLVHTNSVHNALFARTCMLSRKQYRGLTIDFLPDECAAALRVPSVQSYHNPLAASKESTPSNLFEMLSLENCSDASDAENRPPGREDDDDNTIDDDDSSYGVSLRA